jgi:hypothetical protein
MNHSRITARCLRIAMTMYDLLKLRVSSTIASKRTSLCLSMETHRLRTYRVIWIVRSMAVQKILLMTRLTKLRGKSFPTKDLHNSPNTQEIPTKFSSTSTVLINSANKNKNKPRSKNSDSISIFQSSIKYHKSRSRKKKNIMKKARKSRKSLLSEMTHLSLLMNIL